MKFWIIISAINWPILSFGWGFYGHQKINEICVYTIPKPLFGFYKYHVDYMVKHAVDADKRRYVVEGEACKHYLDGDHYEKAIPIDSIPKLYSKAIELYGKDTVLSHGIVPWQVYNVLHQLTQAFKVKDIARILKLSADLGHYVGDCHVPLHATSNYNGQKTNQHGIHGLWESRLPELYFPTYNMFTGLASYCQSPLDSIWKAYEGSFYLVDSVLKTERMLNASFDANKKYAWEQRGAQTVKVYSKAYSEAYHLALGDMVENRMRASIILLGSLIYTAWVDAGQPDLPQFPVDDSNDSDSTTILNGQPMIGRPEE